MITKIQLENLKINGWTVNNFEIDLNSGLNIVRPDHCDFIISIFKYIVATVGIEKNIYWRVI